MEEIIAYCGIICSNCDVYLATINNDNNLRNELVQRYTTNEHTPKLEDFYCEGCFNIKGDGCTIRQCASNKKVDNCAMCTDYYCNELSKHFTNSNESKKTLDEIKGKLL